MKLLLSISLFLAAVIDTHGRVDDNFNNCRKYFYQGQIPSGFQGIAKPDLFDPNNFPDGIKRNELASPAYICQMSGGTYRFATLYDRGRRMPLYSAYIMDARTSSCSPKCIRPKNFKLEPQLVYRGVDGNMVRDATNVLKNYNKIHGIDERKEKNRPSYLIKTSQATDEDYTNKAYDRGHLNPCGHHSVNQDEFTATFTLTNVAPILVDLNKNIWSPYEEKMINMSKQCTAMYVIAGIVPGNVPVKKGGLTAPAYVWNAYCCVDNNDKPLKFGAALADNTMNSKFQKFDKIVDFQANLKNLLGVTHGIELFTNNCSP